MKHIQFCRDGFIRFYNNYDQWLLNKEWKVLPSLCMTEEEGMTIIVCKEHNEGSTKAYVHVLRQPNHIIPCKYSDQICPAVINTRNISQVQKYSNSNTYHIMEQRGKFNGLIPVISLISVISNYLLIY